MGRLGVRLYTLGRWAGGMQCLGMVTTKRIGECEKKAGGSVCEAVCEVAGGCACSVVTSACAARLRGQPLPTHINSTSNAPGMQELDAGPVGNPAGSMGP